VPFSISSYILPNQMVIAIPPPPTHVAPPLCPRSRASPFSARPDGSGISLLFFFPAPYRPCNAILPLFLDLSPSSILGGSCSLSPLLLFLFIFRDFSPLLIFFFGGLTLIRNFSSFNISYCCIPLLRLTEVCFQRPLLPFCLCKGFVVDLSVSPRGYFSPLPD